LLDGWEIRQGVERSLVAVFEKAVVAVAIGLREHDRFGAQALVTTVFRALPSAVVSDPP